MSKSISSSLSLNNVDQYLSDLKSGSKKQSIQSERLTKSAPSLTHDQHVTRSAKAQNNDNSFTVLSEIAEVVEYTFKEGILDVLQKSLNKK